MDAHGFGDKGLQVDNVLLSALHAVLLNGERSPGVGAYVEGRLVDDLGLDGIPNPFADFEGQRLDVSDFQRAALLG